MSWSEKIKEYPPKTRLDLICFTFSDCGRHNVLCEKDIAYLSSDFGNSYLPVPDIVRPTCCAMSASGDDLLVGCSTGNLHTLHNVHSFDVGIVAVGMCADGDVQVAVLSDGSVHKSTDFGVSFSFWFECKRSAVVLVDVSKCGSVVLIVYAEVVCIIGFVNGNNFSIIEKDGVVQATSGDMQYNSLIIDNKLLVSSDYEATWTDTLLKDCRFVSVSECGKYQLVGCATNFYTSDDYGSTFSEIRHVPQGKVLYLKMSPTGKVQGVLIEKDWKFVSYFMSNDFGKTWCERCGNTALYDRNYAFAIIGRRVGVSSDFGETFTLVGPCRDWVGNYIADDDSWRVYDDASREYVSQTRGKTWVRIK